MEERNVVVQPEISPVLRLIYKNLLLIIILTVLCAGLGLGFGFYRVKPVYTASKTVILRASTDNATSTEDAQNKNDVSLAKRILPNVAADLKSTRVEEYANETYAGEGKIDCDNVSTQYSDDSFVFVIRYSDTDQQTVNDKLDAVIRGFNNYLDVDNADYEVIMAKDLRLISLQNRPSDLAKKYRIAWYVVGGAVLGMAIAFGYVFIKHALDNTVKSKETLETLTDSALLSVIDK